MQFLSIISIIFFGAECLASLTEEFENVSISIPYPSGVTIIDSENDNGQLRRYGYLDHNIVALRKGWSKVVSLPGVVSDIEAKIVVETAEKYASHNGGWSKGYRSNVATTELSLLSVFGSQSEVFYDLVSSLILPGITKNYGVNHTDLSLGDLFITKYEVSAEEQSDTEVHKSNSVFSFDISLNDGFSGGGTQFSALPHVWAEPVGTAVVFSDTLPRTDLRISNGVRYILSGFFKMGKSDYNFRMNYYSPQYDGFAAEAGFVSGDEIIDVQCSTVDAENADSTASERSCLAEYTEKEVQTEVVFVVRRTVKPTSSNATSSSTTIHVLE